jgi:hypothetical protein
MNIQVGDTIGDYRVIALLGKGGMGRVFRVRSLLTDREEAMKVIGADLEEHPELAERFMREIKVHASLDHPNIAALRAAVRVGDGIAMILELVEGFSVEHELRSGALQASAAVRHVADVLSALDYAHSRGVIHRDIKPANMLVTADGRIKLTDFGIARGGADHRLTGTGIALGSLYYMSPEQIRAGEVDARSDLYSLGVTFYEMLTGRRPIQAESEFAIMNAQLMEVPQPPAEVRPGLPTVLSDLVMRALAKEPKDRFQTAAEFRAALFGRTFSQATAGSQVTAATVAPAAQPAVPVTAPAVVSAELARIEKKLAQAVGPIARRLVADAARRHTALPEICNELAAHIEDAGERAQFLKSCSTATPATGTRVITERVWDAALLARLAQLLSVHLGPIAKVVVSRAAKGARSEEELYTVLAAEISSEPERKRFLSAARNL